MNTSHTPGPWSRTAIVRGDINQGWITSVQQTGIGGLTIANTVMGDSQAECEANARLIAAAPELLDALGSLLSFCEKAHHDCTVLTEARVAIEKAQGR